MIGFLNSAGSGHGVTIDSLGRDSQFSKRYAQIKLYYQLRMSSTPTAYKQGRPRW